MRTFIKFRLLCMGLLTLSSLSLVPQPSEQNHFWTPKPSQALLTELLNNMTNAEKLGQILLLGYPDSRPSKEFLQWIRERYIGGIKIFGWNARDLSSLGESIHLMQSLALQTPKQIPLLVATDQEGGWVRHVKGNTSVTPGNMAIGATGLAADAYKTALIIAHELKLLGINMNFAPTVDLFTNPLAEVIGPRAFSADPVQTAVLSVAFYRGMEEVGVISTAKHFPGHGNASEDSHGSLPIIMDDEATLWNRELVPYRFLIKENLPAIMSGHLAFPNIVGEELAATLSPYFLTNILRDKMGFQGVVVTDELRMWGVRKSVKTMPEICYDAVMAGNDLLLISWEAGLNDAIWDHLMEKMISDPLFHAKVDQSVVRILELKFRYLKSEPRFPLLPDTTLFLKSLPWNDDGFLFEQACRSITVVKDENLPLKADKQSKILLAGQLKPYFDAGRQYFPGADIFDFDYYRQPSRSEQENFTRLAAEYDIIIYCLITRPGITMLKSLENQKDKVIVVSALNPVYLDEVPWIESAIAIYGSGIDSFYAGFGVITGEFEALGKLPIRLEY